MKKLICVLLLAVIATAFFGCSLFPDKEYKISYDLKAEPINLDPQTAWDTASLTVINNIFEGLFTLDMEGKPVKALVSDYTVSSDGMTYTFNLKDKLQWENEKALTAFDFQFALRRMVTPTTNSPYAKKYYSIKNAEKIHLGLQQVTTLGVVATSDTQLVITLESKNENLLVLLSQTAAMPCNEEYFKETRGRYGLEPTTVLSNGVFKLGSWKHKEFIRIDKNDKYHSVSDKLPSAVSLWINTNKVVDDKQVPNTAVSRLLEAKVLCAEVDGFDVGQFSQNEFTIALSKSSTMAMIFNQKRFPISNENLRLAIAHCFNRDTYKDELDKSMEVANAIIPPTVMLASKSYRDFAGKNITPPFNSDTAFEFYKQGLVELDKSSITSLDMIVIKNDKLSAETFFSHPSQLLQKELGIFINIKELSQSEYTKAVTSGDYDIALTELVSPDGKPETYIKPFYSGNGKNQYGYDNADFNAMYDKILTSPNISVVNDSLKSVERMLIDSVSLIPIYYKSDFIVTNNELIGVEKNPFNGLVSFKNVTLRK